MADALQRLLARQAIEDVLTAYCRLLDRMALAELAALFTADCVVIYAENAAFSARGREALEASLARMWRWRRTAHHLANAMVWFDDDDAGAHAESYVFAWHERPDGGTATVWGRYLDRFVREGDAWRIAERRMDMNGADAGFTVPLPQAPRRPPPPGWAPPDLT